MKTRFLLLVFSLTMLSCATNPEKLAGPDNSNSIERAEKSFQELDKEED